MPAVKGRSRRGNAEAITVPMQGYVAPETRAKARAIADALGVSMSKYIDTLIANDELDDSGRPLWWPEDQHDEPHPELPLQNAS